jgi:hypothetical protein
MGKDPPYLEAVQNPLEDIALGRGVRYRGVYAPEALNGANLLEIREPVRRGEEARVLPGLRTPYRSLGTSHGRH